LGGEESGGIGTKLYLPERDATVTSLLLVELMAWHGKGLGDLVRQLEKEFGEHQYGRVDLELKPGQKERAIEYFSRMRAQNSPSRANNNSRWLDWDITRTENMDGVKIYLGGIGWLLIRASGTEAMLRLYAETSRPGTTRRILSEASKLVQAL